MSQIHSDWIPDFITAQSPMGLRRMMFITNAKAGTQFKYFDIQLFKDENGKTKWIAWFYRRLDDIKNLSDGSTE